MSKNILLILSGFIIGIVVGVAGIYFLYTKTILPASIDDLGIAEDFKPAEVTKNIANMKKVDSFIPKTLASEKYNTLFESIINTANQVAKNNNESIYPAMQILKEMSLTGNWDGIFNIVTDVKSTIKTNRELIATMKESLLTFQAENSVSTRSEDFKYKSAVFAESGLKLVDSYNSYFMVLSQFLTGKVPTKELADSLNVRIKDLSDRNWDFQKQINTVYAVIDAENGKVQQQVNQQ